MCGSRFCSYRFCWRVSFTYCWTAIAGGSFIPGIIFVLLGQTPSLHLLQLFEELPEAQARASVRRLHRYYVFVRLFRFVHHRFAPFGFTARTCAQGNLSTAAQIKPEISRLPIRRISPSLRRLRLPREMLRCVHEVCDTAGPDRPSRWRIDRCCLPRDITSPASRTLRISELNTQPAVSPVNASPVSSRIATHDSEPTWLARPSSCETFIHCTPPALPGHDVPFTHRNRNGYFLARRSKRC